MLSNLDTDADAVATPSGGRWLGAMVEAQDSSGRALRIYNCRTFLN
jgi:hypothetical protein